MTPKPIRVLLAMCALASVSARTSHAQQRSQGVLDGFVSDSTLAPIADATISILGSSLHVATGANGRFRIVSLAPGQYILAIHKLGYVALSTSIVVGGTDTLRLSFALARVTTVLDTMAVNATRLVARLTEFDARRRLGQGRFLTQADIEKYNVVGARDLFVLVPFVSVSSKGLDSYAINSRSGCSYQFFVDGVKLPYPTKLESELPPPREIAGVEIYSNSAFVPAQYKTYDGGGFCGVVLIWTRAGN